MLEDIKKGFQWFHNLPMYVHIGIVALALVLTFVFPQTGNAQQLPPNCMKREVFERLADDRVGQKQVFSGVVEGQKTGQPMLFEIVMNTKTGMFAVVQTVASEKMGLITCILTEGVNGEVVENPTRFNQEGQKG